MEASAVYDMVRIRGTLSFESFGFFGFLRFQYYCCSTFWEHLGVHDSWLYMYIYDMVRKILFVYNTYWTGKTINLTYRYLIVLHDVPFEMTVAVLQQSRDP